MSYILDALKKSDQERKRGDVPGLQTVHIPLDVEQKSPRILYAFIVLLLVVLAFVIGLLVRDRGTEPGVNTGSVENDSEFASRGNIYIDEASTGQSRSVLSDVHTSTPIGVEVSRIEKPTVSEARVEPQLEAVVSSVKAAKNTVSGLNDIPYLSELPAYKQQSVPRFEFAGHVYSSTAYNRSVIINGVAMSEGDTIIQGLKLEQITPSGVVFSLHDERFRIDVLQDWSFE